ncbi:membrane protein insertion efficiency factor YidD [Methylophilus glucosoxydans]|uniref:Membrane protein insertion efficiency factor YidD n=1 Tax=Methylophilus glucosoxydans TaxID=752553 RepID=A0ABW3GJ76_9PROT
MKSLLLKVIRFYQRFISPYKGFCCSYRYHTGHASCSVLGLRAVQRYGVIDGFIILRKRLYLCGVSSRRYSPPKLRPHRSQRGDCDIGCDSPCDMGCKMPNLKSCPIFEAFNCADACSCDWPARDKKDKNNDEEVYLPPKR